MLKVLGDIVLPETGLNLDGTTTCLKDVEEWALLYFIAAWSKSAQDFLQCLVKINMHFVQEHHGSAE